MIGRIVLLAIAGAVILGATRVAWQNRQHARIAGGQAARHVADQRDAEKRQGEIRRELAVAEALTAARKNPSSPSSAIPALESSAARPADAPPRHEEESVARLLEATRDNPVVENAELESRRFDLKWMHEPLFRRLGLVPAAKDHFVDNLVRRVAEHRNLLSAARALGVDDYDPVVERLNAASEASYLAAQRELLGEAGVREMQAYDRAGHARSIAHGFAGMATVASEPLSRRQVEELIQIIDAATSVPFSRMFPRMIDVDWAAVDAQAEIILSPAQARLFKTAEGPGMGRGGTQFVLKLNQAISAANLADRGKVPKPAVRK
jgi:hypothetical protein